MPCLAADACNRMNTVEMTSSVQLSRLQKAALTVLILLHDLPAQHVKQPCTAEVLKLVDSLP